MWSVVHSQEIN